MKQSIISIAGSDRLSFLQGQLTQDVEQVSEALGLPAAWCTPKGRVIVTCRVFAADDRFFLSVPETSAEGVLKRLSMYRLRADVELAVTDDYRLAAIPAERGVPSAAGVSSLSLPFATKAAELFGTPAALEAAGVPEILIDDEAWAVARCAAGLVDITPETAEEYTPHMLNLDRTGAVSFTKGCYTGQEIVARTENLGKAKRRINRYLADGGPLAVGQSVTQDGAPAGQIVATAANEVLAVVAVDRHAENLAADSVRLAPAPLPYSV